MRVRSSMKALGTAGAIFSNSTGTAAWNSIRSAQLLIAKHTPSLPPGNSVGAGCRRSSTRAMS